MIINSVILQRKIIGPSNSLFGELIIKTVNHGTLKFNTVENTNKAVKSGTYDMRWSLSPKFKTKTLEIMGIPNRHGIRIHPGNRGYDFEGCIGIGIYNEYKGIPVQIWNSRQSTEIVESLLWRGEEQITIIDINNERKINTKVSNSSTPAFA
jgi:hypothetical protein